MCQAWPQAEADCNRQKKRAKSGGGGGGGTETYVNKSTLQNGRARSRKRKKGCGNFRKSNSETNLTDSETWERGFGNQDSETTSEIQEAERPDSETIHVDRKLKTTSSQTLLTHAQTRIRNQSNGFGNRTRGFGN